MRVGVAQCGSGAQEARDGSHLKCERRPSCAKRQQDSVAQRGVAMAVGAQSPRRPHRPAQLAGPGVAQRPQAGRSAPKVSQAPRARPPQPMLAFAPGSRTAQGREEPQTLAPGSRVVFSGRAFAVTRPLGKGSFGVVWGARGSDGAVAIKEIVCKSEADLARVVAEGQLLKVVRERLTLDGGLLGGRAVSFRGAMGSVSAGSHRAPRRELVLSAGSRASCVLLPRAAGLSALVGRVGLHVCACMRAACVQVCVHEVHAAPVVEAIQAEAILLKTVQTLKPSKLGQLL